MIHVAICDDEKYMSDMIRRSVSDFFRKKNMEITISQFSSGESLLKYEKKNRYSVSGHSDERYGRYGYGKGAAGPEI